MAAGIVYLSEDRKGKGLLLRQNLRTNLTLTALDQFTRGPFIDVGAENAALDAAIGDFDIRARRRDMLAGELSGGNQQKLLLAKMMLAEPRIVIIDEPTRGVDIGNKEQIYRFIAGLAEQGRSVIVISSEMQELIGLCHRVIVMRNGRICRRGCSDRTCRRMLSCFLQPAFTRKGRLRSPRVTHDGDCAPRERWRAPLQT